MLLLTSGDFRTRSSETMFFSKYAALLHILVRMGDVAIVVLTACLAHWARFDSLLPAAPSNSAVLRVLLLTLLVFPLFGLYRSWRGESLGGEVARMALAWSTVMVTLLLSEWAVKSVEDYSRLWLGTWFVAALALLGLHRWVGRRLLGSIRARGIDARKVVLVGATHAGRRIVAAARQSPWMGLDVIGYVQTPYDQQTIADVPCAGDLDAFIASLQQDAPDQVWVALPMRAEAEIKRLLDATSELPTTIRLVPDLFGYELLNHQASMIAGVPVITLRGTRVEGHARIAKAVEDRLLALVILLLLAPLMVLIAIGVKLSSPGPVLYRQKRNGLGGKEIDVWKFRSMRMHVEPGGQVTQATANDPRVTRFGRFLRASSLDELPQFINVLQGQMSIVGPRPHAVAHNHYFRERLDGYMQRYGVKPGLTGLAQISGFRGETDTIEKMARRVECDIEYIKSWSIWLDLKIILRTPRVLLKRTNAY
jgi:Undecaprenyl-phosphate glucose phosphotransferase